MKSIFLSVSLLAAVSTVSHAQVYINEVLANPPGADSNATRGLELFELRGTANMSLSGFYLLSLEGQGTTGRGDVNQFFDLGAFSLGANGYLTAVQFNSPYSIAAGAAVISNNTSFGWGQVNAAQGSSVGHSSDGSQVDLENSATTIMLVNIGAGSAPLITTDLDADDDGNLELPSGWTIFDSIGLSDSTGTAPAVTDFSYGAITFRIGGVGSSNQGNVIDLPGTGSSLYVARVGESTGSVPGDWFGAVLNGTAPGFVFTNSTDSYFNGRTLDEINLGGINPVPEPSTWALFGLGLAGLGLRVARRRPVATR